MQMSTSRAVPVTLAEIARLAGVGRAAVSNWRRRHPSFPERIAGTDTNPQFSLADIEGWLRENKKLKKSAEREWLWPGFEALGGRDETGAAIAEVGRLLSGRVSDEGAGSREIRAEARELIERAVDLGQREGGMETFAFLLRRWLDVHVRQIATTPELLASLMAELALWAADRVAGDGPGISGGTTVMDPACGPGNLLLAAADAVRASGAGALTLLGSDRDAVLSSLADSRMALAENKGQKEKEWARVSVQAADSLRNDPFSGTRADIVLCNPPFNERDWGYEELATDARWSHGLPPRTEPELAWVQHCLAQLRPGGAAVLLLPPAVAARKAGRRIRGSLLRTGQLRAVVALPPGCAAPHSVSLHLWVLRMPTAGEGAPAGDRLLVADAASRFPRDPEEKWTPDWTAISAFVREAVAEADSPHAPAYVRQVPVIELLNDEVDLTPGRHIAPSPADTAPRLAEAWREFTGLTAKVNKSAKLLAALDLATAEADTPTATTVAELARAGALTLRSGQQPPEESIHAGPPPDDGIPLLTVPDLLVDGEPRSWLAHDTAAVGEAVIAEPGDIVVVGVARAFSAWVHEGPPTALGPQLHAVQVQPEQLDAWFLAGSLRAPANARQAGTHTTNSSRIDVRRLQIRQVPLSEQRRYGEAFRELTAFERLLRRSADLGTSLARDLGDELAAGRLAHQT
ncbi:type II restriction endonuclease subunit M [Streptomyces gardneri]|uniref:Type II restriction endonuclease subunit M n=2 Tax=Streptomyces gardneri TaxID=66892 RepID=A0A4Y3RML1_9ACTN|nr:type II restriction endonuclease subunit M [Streptomyces gardneri]GHH12262.1 type II restriction endonuclease subunit M [Streptomyces gardneri]